MSRHILCSYPPWLRQLFLADHEFSHSSFAPMNITLKVCCLATEFGLLKNPTFYFGCYLVSARWTCPSYLVYNAAFLFAWLINWLIPSRVAVMWKEFWIFHIPEEQILPWKKKKKPCIVMNLFLPRTPNLWNSKIQADLSWITSAT